MMMVQGVRFSHSQEVAGRLGFLVGDDEDKDDDGDDHDHDHDHDDYDYYHEDGDCNVTLPWHRHFLQ